MNIRVLFAITFTMFFTNSLYAQLSYSETERMVNQKLTKWKGGFFCLKCYSANTADVESINKISSNEYLVKGTYEHDMSSKARPFRARFTKSGSGKVRIEKLCISGWNGDFNDEQCEKYN